MPRRAVDSVVLHTNQACACACGEHIRDRPNEEGGQDVIGHHTLPDVETAEVIRQERTDYEDFARIKAPRQVEYARDIPARPDQRIHDACERGVAAQAGIYGGEGGGCTTANEGDKM